MRVSAALPRQAWLQGQMNNSSVDVRWDRTQNSATGTVGRDSVDVRGDDSGLHGWAHGNPVELGRDWSPQHVHLEGDANGGPTTFDVDYTSHTARGEVNHHQIDVSFDEGSITGTSDGVPLRLTLAKDGRLEGTMHGYPVSASLVNLDTGGFLENYFLFAPTH